MSDFDPQIAALRSELADLPQDDPYRAELLESLAISLHDRFKRLGGLPYLEEAITLFRSALELPPEQQPDRAGPLNNLASALRVRFQQLGGASDLDEAITLLRDAFKLCPEGHPGRSTTLINFATALETRFERVGEMSDLDEAITSLRSALELRPEGHPGRSLPLTNLAAALQIRFRQLGETLDLDEAVTLLRTALELCPEGHPNRALPLINLAALLQTRSLQAGGMVDLDEAITLYRDALHLCPEGHPSRDWLLNNLAGALQTRFKQVGRLSDLDEAIILHRSALELRPEGHFNRSGSLINLADVLTTRFQQVGGMADLDEAIKLLRNALEYCPEGHLNRSELLLNLSAALGTRFDQVGEISDLDEAIQVSRSALEHFPEGHPNRAVQLGTLAATLQARFDHVEETSDLEEAIKLYRKALELCPAKSDRSLLFSNLAYALQTRFGRLGGVSDLDEAATLHQGALELRPQGHPLRSRSVEGIAHCILQHPQASEQRREEAFQFYSTLSEVSQSIVSADLDAAHSWVRATEATGHHTIISAYQTSLRLLAGHFAALPCLPKHLTILKNRMSSLAMDSFSASIRHGTLTSAVALLEQGRGVFWSQLTRLRSPVHEVIAAGGEGKLLGEKFLSVSRALRSILDSNSQLDRVWHLTNELRETADDIRQLPGFSRFLFSPLFSDLQHAASEGPVIIVNASQYSCDAIAVFHERDPIHIPLQINKADVRQWSSDLGKIAKMGKTQDVQTELVILLRELWEHVVWPIIQVLEPICPRRSHIWWCPTAEFSLLPLHAAGEYRRNKPNLPDLYLSSYTPTLTALIRSRRACDTDRATSPPGRFVAVGNGDTPGEAALVNVHAELASIGELVHTKATFTCLEGSDAHVNAVGKELQQSEFVHVACHGIPNPAEPFESGFALSDGLLTIRDIIQYDLQRSRLATLSACHATVGDKDSPDEAIHLAAAMQFIGFRSVIGTMWAVDDEEAKKIMTGLYRIMVDQSGELDHTRAALALHKALRVAKPPLPLFQRILFVHIGA